MQAEAEMVHHQNVEAEADEIDSLNPEADAVKHSPIPDALLERLCSYKKK